MKYVILMAIAGIIIVFLLLGIVELFVRAFGYTKKQIEDADNPVIRRAMKWTMYYKKKAQQAALDAMGEPPEEEAIDEEE